MWVGVCVWGGGRVCVCVCVCVCVSIQAAAENSEDSNDELAGHGDDDVKLVVLARGRSKRHLEP